MNDELNFRAGRQLNNSRREFLQHSGIGLGAMALNSLMATPTNPMTPKPSMFGTKAKRVIYIFQAGGPSQLELFDQKPKLNQLHGEPTPASYLEGKRFSFLKGVPKLLGSEREFGRYGQSGALLSELLPYHREIADELCFVKGLRTNVFNHGPAKLFFNTGHPQPGKPSMGAWITYGIGSESTDLPGFVVLQSGPRGPRAGSTLWSSGFLPTTYQGVPFRSTGDPILFLASPDGVDRNRQRQFTDVVGDLNRQRFDLVGDPEIQTRIASYEMAYQMQTSAPELMDISKEPKHVLDMYGAEPGKASFANNCLLARRLVERGVRFVQLYHTDWDHHGGPNQTLGKDLEKVCGQVDQPSSALIKDLKQNGLLDDTLVIWGGEFGRTPMGETRDNKIGGRDHHIDAFTVWMAGGGIKPGITCGESDDLGLRGINQSPHVHDVQATILHQLGLDHEKLTFKFQGRDFRLTDVHGHVMRDILT
ncbi:MAG: DUF1501 domain-containing protein [Limisphaerales bacterium]